MNATITSDYRPVLDDPIEAASDPRPLALFTSNLHTGGAERVTVNLLRVAAAAGIPLDLLLARAEGPLLAEVPPQVRVINFGVARVRGAIPQLVRYLRRERPRGVISHMTHVNLTAIAARALARTGTPVICVEHSQFSTSSAARAAHPWELTFASWLYPWADHIVGVSRGVARNVEQSLGLPQGRVQSIYNPIVDSHLLAKAEQPCPHPWFAASDRPVLLSVGHLGRPEKDHTMLL
ncbi:MAG TPA: glycosyltransferase, partial [Pirellulales bacterium]|nr:glycosyltransferase [Pirellulales bacterium]